jgi:hypothetical protein
VNNKKFLQLKLVTFIRLTQVLVGNELTKKNDGSSSRQQNMVQAAGSRI